MLASLDGTEAVFADAKLCAALARFANWAADVPFACLFLLVILSSQGFENLALNDIKCGEMPTVMRGKGV